MRKFKFYKDPDNSWYIDLPEWTGSKASLEMVSGADTMLEYLSEGSNEVYAYLSEEYFENSDKIEFIRETDEIGEGAFYKITSFRGVEINVNMWLCGVTEWLYKKYPKVIYIQTI